MKWIADYAGQTRRSAPTVILIMAVMVLMLAGPALADYQAGGMTATQIGESTDEKPSGAIGETLYESDTKRWYVHDGSDWVLKKGVYVTGIDSLTTTGAGTTVEVNGFDEITAVFKGLNTGASGQVTVQGYLGVLGWFNLDGANDSTAVADTTSIPLSYKEVKSIRYVRPYVYSISDTLLFALGAGTDTE